MCIIKKYCIQQCRIQNAVKCNIIYYSTSYVFCSALCGQFGVWFQASLLCISHSFHSATRLSIDIICADLLWSTFLHLHSTMSSACVSTKKESMQWSMQCTPTSPPLHTHFLSVRTSCVFFNFPPLPSPLLYMTVIGLVGCLQLYCCISM